MGTGLVPIDLLDTESLTDAKKSSTGISSFRVQHITGARSLVEFKSYDQGRQAFEGTERSIWCDEEPPEDVYSECLLRTMTGDNIFMLTFTPLKGASGVVLNFAVEGSFEEGPIGDGKHVTTATWDDVPHLSEQAKKELLASIPPYQRDARSKGVPALGAGAIFPVEEDVLFVEPFELPAHWKRCFGMDVGWKRTAAIWGAIDPESNITYLYSEHYLGEAVPSTHAQAIRARGDWIPGVIDPASRGRTQDDGNQLMQNYVDLGLDIEKAANHVESALWEMLEAMQQGRLKVFTTLTNFRREFRSYVRDEKGKVVKVNDHLCFHGDTLVWTDAGKKPIKDLVGTTGTLLSTSSYEPYEDVRLIKKDQSVVEVVFEQGSVICTPDHKFLTTSGWVEAIDLAGYNVLRNNYEQTQWTPSSLAQPNSVSTALPTTPPERATFSITGVGQVDDCIALYGNIITELFRKVGRYITSMVTSMTTALRTFNVFRQPLTAPNTPMLSPGPLKADLLPPNGTEVQRGVNGIQRWQRRQLDAQAPMAQNIDASSATRPSSLYETQAACAVKHAVPVDTATTCLEVRAVSGTTDVYCLTVPTTQALIVGPGVVAHNCDSLRYLWNSGRERATTLQAAKGVNNVSMAGTPTIPRRF